MLRAWVVKKAGQTTIELVASHINKLERRRRLPCLPASHEAESGTNDKAPEITSTNRN